MEERLAEVEKLRIRRFKLDSPCFRSIIYIKNTNNIDFWCEEVYREEKQGICVS